MMVQTPRAQQAICKGAVRVISNLRQDFRRLEFMMKRYSSSTAMLSEWITKEAIRER
jgi:hypothetical protein